MKNYSLILTALLLTVLGFPSKGLAKGKTSAGLTLLGPQGARAAALAEAYSAASNDISALGFNPSLLSTLQTGQASFLLKRDVFDSTFGLFHIGRPLKNGGVGMSIGYFDGDSIHVFDGVKESDSTAQRDITVTLGLAQGVGPISFGVSGKYLSSELAETDHATAFAGDFGVNWKLNHRLRIGAAVQNIGSELKFNDEGDDLPRMARTGFSFSDNADR